MILVRSILGFLSFVLACSVHAQVQTVTYRLDFFHETASHSEAKLASDAVEAIIGEKDRPQKQVGLYPDSLPVTPGAPAYRSVNMGLINQQLLQCNDAFAQFTWSKDTGSNPIGGSGERYTGCVFISQAGIRSSIIIERYTRTGGSILGGLISGIRNAIQGDDAEWGDKVVERFTGIYKARVPNVLIELIETPKGIQHPDGVKVSDLITKAKQQASAATAQTSTPQALPLQGVAAVIDARKNLTAMGMVYHSVDQLQDAIIRRDPVSVELFVQANGVRADAKGKSGQTSAEVAQSVGDTALIEAVKQLK